jgi:two-component system, NarL family, sensor histidine kinase UhpB
MRLPAGTARKNLWPVSDLKWSLMWKVVLVALLCFVGSSAVVVYRVADEAFQANKSLADAIGRRLEMQMLFREWTTDVRGRFLEADAIITQAMSPGQCLQYIDAAGEPVVSNCLGFFSSQGQEAPDWFTALYRRTLEHRMVYAYPIAHKGVGLGKIVVSTVPAAVTSRAWSDISRMLGFSAATIAALCVLVYFAIERALRPTKDVLVGLNRLGMGDLKYRLPPFRLAELQRISEVFNDLAAKLEATISERAGLAKRLVDAREQERRRLARVLHDELAQSLTAMSATAASIKITASTDCPSLVPEAQVLSETAVTIMKRLRETLQELRTQEIDEIGLRASLEGLIAHHNGRACAKTRFLLETHGDVNALPSTMKAHIFHIVQEGLTNAIKHAGASNVRAVVRACSGDGAAQTANGSVEVLIEDDGVGLTHEMKAETGFGLGLIGIRERALALGGQMTVGSGPEKGLTVSVAIPSIQESPT